MEFRIPQLSADAEGAPEGALPEKALLSALLCDALLEVAGEARGIHFNSQTERRMSEARARRWLLSDEMHADPDRGLSFAWVCEQLGLDHVSLRASFFAFPKRIAGTRRHIAPRYGKTTLN